MKQYQLNLFPGRTKKAFRERKGTFIAFFILPSSNTSEDQTQDEATNARYQKQ